MNSNALLDTSRLRCSEDGEPSHEVAFKGAAYFEVPNIEEYDSNYAEKIKRLCIEWIEKHAHAKK